MPDKPANKVFFDKRKAFTAFFRYSTSILSSSSAYLSATPLRFLKSATSSSKEVNFLTIISFLNVCFR